MFELLGTALSAILGGGATGLFGVSVQRYFDLQKYKLDIALEQQKFSHELALRKVDAEIMAQEWAARTQVASVEAEGRSDVADSQAFAASFTEPMRYAEGIKATRAQGWLLVLLDFFRGIVRPGLTIYLCVLTTLIYLHCRELLAVPDLLAPTEAIDLLRLVINTVLYLTTTAVLWWFGTRNRGKAPKL